MNRLTPVFLTVFLFSTLLSCDTMGQSFSEFDYDRYSFSEADVLNALKDSTYLGLSYLEITSMQPKEVWNFSQKSNISLTKVLIAQSTARTDLKEIRSAFLKKEAQMIYEDIDRSLGIEKK